MPISQMPGEQARRGDQGRTIQSDHLGRALPAMQKPSQTSRSTNPVTNPDKGGTLMAHIEPAPRPGPEGIPCCPQLDRCEPCDILHISYRLPFRPTVEDRVVPVEVVLRYTLTRCPGPLALGPLVYTTTLLPGEKVRLATTDRHSTFSVDSDSHLSYRNRSSSEESFYMAGFAQSVSDLTIVDTTRRNSSYHESAVSGGGSAGLDLGIFEIGGSVSGSSFDASSAATIARNFSQHARETHSHVESGVRAASSVSVGEVNQRFHREGESDDHFESSSREFANPNQCRALTFLFHQIVKCQKVKFELAGVDIRVVDPVAPTGVALAPPRPLTGLTVVPQAMASTSPRLLEAERAARSAASERVKNPASEGPSLVGAVIGANSAISADSRNKAVAEVFRALMAAGLIDREGAVSEEARERLGWEKELSLPTPGVQVRGCLDECDVCEPEVHRRITLELDRMELENKLLARRIELMDTDQEHRCCPGSQTEGPES